jgi:hypothetical protein
MGVQLQAQGNLPIVGAANAAGGVMSEAGTVEVLHRGEQYRAAYSVKNGMVHILSTLGKKTPRPPGGSPPEAVARLMLKELLHERDAQVRRR